MAANEDVVSNDDGTAGEHTLAALSRVRVHTRHVSVEAHIRTDNCSATDDDFTWILHVASSTNDYIITKVDIVAVVAVERRLDDGPVANAAGSDHCRHTGSGVAVGLVSFSALGRVDYGGEEAAALVGANGPRWAGSVVVALYGGFALLAILEEDIVGVVKVRLAE